MHTSLQRVSFSNQANPLLIKTMPPRRLNRSNSSPPPPPRKRKTLAPSQRFKLLEAANFTCQTCGRKPPQVQLEIDHIIPFSKGGACDLNNFQVLCRDCNRGKGARLPLTKPVNKKVIKPTNKVIKNKAKPNPKVNKPKKHRSSKFILNKVWQGLLRQPLIKNVWEQALVLISWIQPYLDLERKYE